MKSPSGRQELWLFDARGSTELLRARKTLLSNGQYAKYIYARGNMAKNKIEKKIKNKVEKSAKKRPLTFLLMVALLLGCGVGGYFTASAICKNDCFEIIGEKEVVLTVGETFVDEGARAISFGRDISDKIVVAENTVDTEKAGQYYIKYTVDDFRFKGVERYRIVIVEEVSA